MKILGSIFILFCFMLVISAERTTPKAFGNNTVIETEQKEPPLNSSLENHPPSAEEKHKPYINPKLINSTAPKCKLIVHVENVQNTKGHVVVSLWMDPKYFALEKKYMPDYGIKTKAKEGTVELVFEAIECNRIYGLLTFHDDNDTEDLEKNFLGIPLKAYGFGNNASPRGLYPPHLKDAGIIMDKPEVRTSVKLIY